MRQTVNIISAITAFLLATIFLNGCETEDNIVVSENRPPTIAAVRAFPSLVSPEGLVTLICDARDNDSEHLEVVWSCQDGLFEDGVLGVSVGWTAPAEEGSYLVNVIASDGKLDTHGNVVVTVMEGASSGYLIQLKPENWWEYRVVTYVNDTLRADTTSIITVDSTIEYNGNTWFRLAFDGESQSDIYFRNNFQGLLSLTFSDEYSNGREAVYFRYPTGAGESWTRTDSVSVRVERTEEQMDVPYAHFEGCVLYYERSNGELIREVWMKQDYGYVKTSATTNENGNRVRVEWRLKDLYRG